MNPGERGQSSNEDTVDSTAHGDHGEEEVRADVTSGERADVNALRDSFIRARRAQRAREARAVIKE